MSASAITTAAARPVRRLAIPPALLWGAAATIAVVPAAYAALHFPQHPLAAALAACVILGGVAAVAMRPWAGALALVLIVYANVSDVINDQVHFPLVLAGVIAWTMLAWWAHRRLEIDPEPMHWPLWRPLLALCLAQAVATIGAEFKNLALEQVLETMKELLIFYLLVNLLLSPRRLRLAANAVLAAVVLMAVPVLYQRLTGSSFDFWGFAQTKHAAIFGEHFGSRAAGSIGDPNFFAMILVMALPLAVTQALEAGAGLRRLFAVAAMGIDLAAIVLTYSRAALLGIAFIGVAFLIAHQRRRLVLTCGVLMMLAAMAVMPREYVYRAMTLAQLDANSPQQLTDQSYRGRYSELMVGLKMFVDHPAFGVGPANYPYEYQKYNAVVGLDERHEQRDAHNTFVQMLAETGIFGFAIFIWLLWSALRNIHRSVVRLRAAGADRFADLTWSFGLAMSAYLLLSLFLHAAYFRHFLVIVAFAAAAAELARQLRPAQPVTSATASVTHETAAV